MEMVRPGTVVSAAVWQVIDAGRTTYYQDGVEWMQAGLRRFRGADDLQRERRLLRRTVSRSTRTRLGPPTWWRASARIWKASTARCWSAELEAASALRAGGVAVFNSDYALTYGDVLAVRTSAWVRQRFRGRSGDRSGGQSRHRSGGQ